MFCRKKRLLVLLSLLMLLMDISAGLKVKDDGFVAKGLRVGANAQASSNLQLDGTFARSSSRISSNGELGDHSLYLVDSSSANLTLTLPLANSCYGRTIVMKKTTVVGFAVIAASSSDNISGSSNIIMNEGSKGYLEVHSDGVQWNTMMEQGLGYHLSDNLEYYISFEQGVGTNTVSPDIGTAYGALDRQNFTSDASGWSAGISGNAITFDGVDDVLRNTMNSGGELIYFPMTISFWIKISSTPSSSKRIFTRGDSCYRFKTLQNKDSIRFEWRDVNDTAYQVDVNVQCNGTWTHICATVDDQVRVYCNGVLSGASNPVAIRTTKANSSNSNLFYNQSFGVTWSMDELRIYSRSFSESEVRYLYERHADLI